jgi:putative N6-adenine-specific DNA methylase
MNQDFEMIAKTFQGLENVLAEELTNLGANDIQIGRRMVSFTGDKEMMYRANFALRTAIRILKPIKKFDASDADAVYHEIKNIKWEDILDVNKTFAIDAVVFSEEFRHSKFVAYKVKDAIVDYFREKTGERPSVRINNPDIQLNIHIAENHCTLSLDSSGESLHRRGYRQEAVEAPLNEALAAGMILMTGWRGECDLIDPMCGSGTIPIEAALIARNIAPGVFRKGYTFEKWADFDEDLLQTIYNDDSQEKEQTCHIYGYDNNVNAIAIARNNVKVAGLGKNIELELQSFQDFKQPEQKSLIITNPPYGERISTDDILDLYKMIGERLKHAFTGNEAWILSYHRECFDQIGLKATERIPLFNGALECEFHQYQIFGGKYKEYKGEHADDREPAHNRYKLDRHSNSSDRSPRPNGYSNSSDRRPPRSSDRDSSDSDRRQRGSDNYHSSDRSPRGYDRGSNYSDRSPRSSDGYHSSDRSPRSYDRGSSSSERSPRSSDGYHSSDRSPRSYDRGSNSSDRSPHSSNNYSHTERPDRKRDYEKNSSDRKDFSPKKTDNTDSTRSKRPRNATYSRHLDKDTKE